MESYWQNWNQDLTQDQLDFVAEMAKKHDVPPIKEQGYWFAINGNKEYQSQIDKVLNEGVIRTIHHQALVDGFALSNLNKDS